MINELKFIRTHLTAMNWLKIFKSTFVVKFYCTQKKYIIDDSDVHQLNYKTEMGHKSIKNIHEILSYHSFIHS
jgi:hypothetical protein